MIKITSEIRGPGIEEEYADARAAIDDMRRLMNRIPSGRRSNERMAERDRMIRYAGSRGHLPRV